MKKSIFLVITFCLCSVLILTGCGKTSNGTENSDGEYLIGRDLDAGI
jgi:major membrane immunogen (membrane-anchored lipoprotein)